MGATNVLSRFSKRNTPAWVRWLGIAIGGVIGAIGTIAVGYAFGMGDELRASMLTIGAMFLVIGLSGAGITYRSHPSKQE